MVFLFIPTVLTGGNHFLLSFLKNIPGFAPAEDLGMRHISFVVVASLERPREKKRYGSLLDLYVILSLFVFLSFSIDLFGADVLSEKHLAGASSPDL